MPDEKSFIRVYDPEKGQSVHEIDIDNVRNDKTDELLRFFHEKISDWVYVPDDKVRWFSSLERLPDWFEGFKRRRKVKKAIRNEKLHWPYKDLRKFLGNRVPHLNSMVTWGNEKQRPPSRREINAVKEAIQLALPDNYAPIARQEGHARLISSIWFICRTFKRLSGMVFVVLVLFMVLFKETYGSLNNYEQFVYLANIILNGAIWLVATWVKIIIEKTFHYQRVRELLLILNIAYLAKADPKFARTFWH